MNRAAPSTPHREAMTPWWRSFVFRFVGTFSVVVGLFVLAAVFWLDRTGRAEVEDKFGLVLESIAATAAPTLDGALLERIVDDDDADGDAFRTLRGQLATVAMVNRLGDDQVYILRPEGDAWAFAVMLQEDTFIGDRYEPPPELASLYRWVVEQRDTARTDLYTDAHGMFISGLAPVTTAEGRVTGILHVDYGVDAYVTEARRQSWTLLGVGGGLMLAILLAGAWTHRRLRRRVLALLDGTNAIRAEDYDHRVSIPGAPDELTTLAAAINDVTRRLKERFEMLKFLPAHTRRMIEVASDGGTVGLELAERVNLVVLESDIRGFTSLSERLTPEQTIGMLNQYVRVQAELVTEHGGSIDKYMGDAVLALFEGDDMHRRATRCALDIQRAISRMNDEGAFETPIHIGIGIAVGDVVLGNMGSERRMEHTVIGPAVNLAARLCSAAGGDQVVAQAAVWQAAALDDAPSAEPEQISAKGFRQPVDAVRIRL